MGNPLDSVSLPRLRVSGRWLAHPLVLGPWAMLAAFGAYACMYGLRKPFTAATFTGDAWPANFKLWLVVTQVLGYTASKFIGVRVISELAPPRRAPLLLTLVAASELALILFGLLPSPFNAVGLFLNGLCLGLVFGLVLGFLEGRRITEALVAGLCTSFVLADGMAKTVGSALLQWGVAERWMPGVAGLLFLVPLTGFVAMLQALPPPSPEDEEARMVRVPMTSADRANWLRRHGPGIGCVTAGYLLITVLRSLRSDFAPEIWRALGSAAQPSVFTQSELWVALGVVAVTGSVFLVRDNQKSFFLALGICLAGLVLGGAAVAGQALGWVEGFPMMVLLGLGLYLPYVAVHTTVFERLIAVTRNPGNLGFLLYFADAFGYLGYVAVMGLKVLAPTQVDFFRFFQLAAAISLALAFVAFVAAWLLFRSSILRHQQVSVS